MRELKFRSLYEGVWYYQTLEEILTVTLAAFRLGEHKTQFTGLKDKNGKEIYEGDVLKIFSFKIPIIYRSGTFGYMSISVSDDFISITNQNLSWVNDKSEKIEVIGNIYENKDLLN